jgi:hypothetical protein
MGDVKNREKSDIDRISDSITPPIDGKEAIQDNQLLIISRV